MTTQPSATNIPEFSVSDLAFSLKRTVEDAFSRVRVRGELSRVSIAGSGHMYSSLKDDGAVIDAVCWKGVLGKLSVRPEEGLEVICTGRLSTFPKSSKYQLVIETMELAGEGALLKMLEDRRKKLAAEGLFDPARKKPLPKLPKVIGVVTSPTGAVIRDILHRLKDRMPAHVIVWPALVQGQGADKQIAAGIEGLQNLSQHNMPDPDVIIVARGGGSLEDLMAFNEENVVRAAAACRIPLISAVGHETDTTLIDYVADQRAPTPTGAAEMAVPVRAELMAQIQDIGGRQNHAMLRALSEKSNQLLAHSKGLSDPAKLLDMKTQMLDRMADQLSHHARSYVQKRSEYCTKITAALKHPKDVIAHKAMQLARWEEPLKRAPYNKLDQQQTQVQHLGKMLEAYSFQNVLQRGYAVVRDEEGQILTDSQSVQKKGRAHLEFHGGDSVQISVMSGVEQGQQTLKPKPKKKPRSKPQTDDRQESLF